MAAGAVSHALTTTMDYLPTVVALSGIAVLPTDRTYDGRDLSPVLLHGSPTHHSHLFFSVGGEAFGGVPGGKKCAGIYAGSSQCPLFQAVRTARYSAMFYTGYMASCCRDPATGDANTPFNRSCARGSPDPTLAPTQSSGWLRSPLLFDLSVDVVRRPLRPFRWPFGLGFA
eukprot:COSAG01_NODE_2685_length_7253_cov_6.363153_6_plen_171_part_00